MAYMVLYKFRYADSDCSISFLDQIAKELEPHERNSRLTRPLNFPYLPIPRYLAALAPPPHALPATSKPIPSALLLPYSTALRPSSSVTFRTPTISFTRNIFPASGAENGYKTD